MSAVTIELPDSVLRSLHETAECFAKDVRLLAAVKLYELRKLSSGRAAELAGMSRVQFFHRLADYGVELYAATPDELRSDLEAALGAADDRQ